MAASGRKLFQQAATEAEVESTRPIDSRRTPPSPRRLTAKRRVPPRVAKIRSPRPSQDDRDVLRCAENGQLRIVVAIHPEQLQGENTQAAALRGVLLMCAVVLAKSGEVGQETVASVSEIFRTAWRASSLVECVNSVVRMQQARHRRMTQGLIDLKRLYWNTAAFRTGRRRKKSPYEHLGVKLPERIGWWELLNWPPERLRQQLSARNIPD